MAQGKMMNKKEIAEELAVSEKTITRWMKDRKIPYSNINGIIRFDPEKIKMWLSRKEVRPKQ
jgi:excisionase family DNA binding protein